MRVGRVVRVGRAAVKMRAGEEMGEDVGFERVARGGRELWCQPYMQPVLCWDGTRNRTALPDTARHGIPIGRSSVSVMWQCVSVSVCVCLCVCVCCRKKIGRA